MERKTKIHADKGSQEILIIREFDLPLDLLFRAYVEPEIVEQWMGTKVLKLDSKKHGSFQFETTDPHGNKYRFNGVIHDFTHEEKITRTFEFEGIGLGVQLEFLRFEKLTDETSKLIMRVLYESVAQRDQQLKMPFSQGLNMAHNRLQDIVIKLK